MKSAAGKISVCMATRDGECHIGEQLASILAQLGPDDELVISDDSSSDRTLEIIKAFDDRRIRLLAGNTFFSPIFNFEHALRHAAGEIVVLADQDDIWLDNKIELIRKRFARPHSPVYLVVLDGLVINAEGEVMAESIFAKINSGPGLGKNIYDNTYMGCCLAFSRELLEFALPFPPRIPMHDNWLGLLAELFGTVEFVAEPTIKYRKHPGSTTSFVRRFQPWLQLKRRFFLSGHLAGRWLAKKWPGKTYNG